MKTKKTISKINKILMSELLNFKIYKTKNKKLRKNVEKSNNVFFLKQTFYSFKKILQVVFQYHFYREKILTVTENLPLTDKRSFYLYKKTGHTLMLKENWVNGLLSNKKKLKNLFKKNFLLKSIKKPRLFISYNYLNLLDSERHQQRITDVTLNHNHERFFYRKNFNYFIKNNFDTTKKKSFYKVFSVLIKKIIKTPKLHLSCFFTPSSYTKKQFFKKRRKLNKKQNLKKFYPVKFRIKKNYQKKQNRYKNDFKTIKKK